MSRVILTKYDTGEERLVVGWDHAAGGAFWQEFNPEPDPAATHEELDSWEEVARYGGMWPGIPLPELRKSMPTDLRRHVTDDVLLMLALHSRDPESGRMAPLDLSHPNPRSS